MGGIDIVIGGIDIVMGLGIGIRDGIVIGRAIDIRIFKKLTVR